MNQTQSTLRYTLLDTLLNDLLFLRAKEVKGNPLAFREEFQRKLQQLRDSAGGLGITKEEGEFVTYFLVAGVDEAAIAYGGEFMSLWMKGTLQFSYYGSNIAGQQFYDKLHMVQVEGERYPVALYVAYRVLSSGFLGKYFSDKVSREAVIEQSARQLVPLHSARVALKDIASPSKGLQSFSIKGWMFAVAFAFIIAVTWLSNRIVSTITTQRVIEASQTAEGIEK